MLRRLMLAKIVLLVIALSRTAMTAEPDSLRLAVFQADVTPPLGAPLCDGLVPPAAKIDDRLTARGVVLLGQEKPIVLCAVDWVGIGNTGHDAWRQALATAAETSVDRVAVHCLHQHDAPGCDFAAEELAAGNNFAGQIFDVAFAREAITRTADAVKQSLTKARTISHVGLGKAKAEQVASNRRILGPDGKVKAMRLSSCRDEAVRAEPEGVIDPFVRVISFWDGESPVASLTYYATHPQSYYGRGAVSADFVGMARGLREKELPQFAHIHFNGASGNVAAGKYNDGSEPRRAELADRLAAAMRAAWEESQKMKLAVSANDVRWRVEPVALPPRDTLDEAKLRATLADTTAVARERVRAARELAFLLRCRSGHQVPLGCLHLGTARVIHMPGELFIEYQLAAQQMRPGSLVCMAAYGDYGSGYIGTQIAYSQGGYETSYVSRTAPEVEAVLMTALKKLTE